MTINYSFKITSCNRLILYIDEDNQRYENLITKINYQYIGVDSDDNTTAIFNSSINLPKPTTSDYKNYNELTESDIIIWLESLISTDELTLMKTVIENNITDTKTKTSLPWIT
jgi:hypothetical protein